MTTDAANILYRYWGYKAFRTPQEEIIRDVTAGKNVIAVMPTGSGKSLCYQLPPLLMDKGLTLVISPLVSLMKDQVKALKDKGIRAEALVSGISANELDRILQNAKLGKVSLLYFSPERLQSSSFQEYLAQLSPTLIAIDEAHCISEWGHDFRPSYLRIKTVRELFGNTPVLALTATATTGVIKDIAGILELDTYRLYRVPSRRDNVSLHVRHSENKYGDLLEILSEDDKPAIVYISSRKYARQVSDFLNSHRIPSGYYHAGLSIRQRDKIQKSWLEGSIRVMVATPAFGMGIDKADVRTLVHLGIPFSLEAYVQETGRAGRDGKPSRAILLENMSLIDNKKKQFARQQPDVSTLRNVYHALNRYYRIPTGSKPGGELDFEMQDFCRTYGFAPATVYHSLKILESEEVLIFNDYNRGEDEIQVLFRREELQAYFERNPQKKEIIQTLMRTYDGILDYAHPVQLEHLPGLLRMTGDEISMHLQQAEHDRVIRWKKQTGSARIRFLKERDEPYLINRFAGRVERLQRHKISRYGKMIDFVTNRTQCRYRFIAGYFDEEMDGDCGICDICTHRPPSPDDSGNTEQRIIDKLTGSPASSQELGNSLGITDEILIRSLRQMLLDERIKIDSRNRYYIP